MQFLILIDGKNDLSCKLKKKTDIQNWLNPMIQFFKK